MAYSKKGVGDIHYIVDTKDDLNAIENPNMGSTAWVVHEAVEYMADSKGEWVPQTAPSAENNTSAPSGDFITKADLDAVVEKLLTKEDFEKSKVNSTFGEDEEVMASNPGSAFGIAINKGDTKTIIDAMIEKGIGLYTFWIHKTSEDLPAEVKAKNSSCRGLCCVDTAKDTGWYGWIVLFDHDGCMYSRYIRNSAPTEWHAC